MLLEYNYELKYLTTKDIINFSGKAIIAKLLL